jgi:photosystem I reaction center subunit XII
MIYDYQIYIALVISGIGSVLAIRLATTLYS